jgi:hypothetical protein
MDIEHELKELLVQATVNTYKETKGQNQVDGVTEYTMIKNVASVQELLDYIRVVVKYLTFDLEATRRENLYLRKILEDFPE